MDRKKNGQGKLPMWQERLRRNSAAMREEFEQMYKRTALYNGTREIEKTPDAKSSKAAAQASGVRNIVAELMEAQVDSSFPMPLRIFGSSSTMKIVMAAPPAPGSGW